MEWLRLYTEARNDRKLESLTDSQFRVWFRLLCLSGEQEERGTIKIVSPRLFCLEVANGDSTLLDETLLALEELVIITRKDNELTFVNFAKRQYLKPSDTPKAVGERVTKHRSKKNGNCNAPVTRSNADVTPSCNAIAFHVTPTEQNRTEQNNRPPSTSRYVPTTNDTEAELEADKARWGVNG